MIRVDALTLRFGGVTALSDVSFEIPAGVICGIIGPNGAGKTSLFNCMTGLYRPSSGRISFEGHDLTRTPVYRMTALGIARTFQNVGLIPDRTVFANVSLGAYPRAHRNFALAMVQPWASRGERVAAARTEELLETLDLSAVRDTFVGDLPYGTLKRVELARALVAEPTLLLLDEPAAGLVQHEVGELADLIRLVRDQFDVTVLLVEHHVPMVMSMCHRVIAMASGRVIADGTPDEVRRDDGLVSAYLGSRATRRAT